MDEKLKILTGLLNAEKAQDREAQYYLLRGMALATKQHDMLDRDSFDLLVEDAIPRRSMSVRKAARLVEETGAFHFADGQWEFRLPAQGCDKEFFYSLFFEASPKEKAVSSLDNPVREAIIRAVKWHIEMTLTAIQSGEIPGLPAFCSCDAHGDHLIGYKAAGTANSDSLSMFCLCLDYLPECERDFKDISDCISFLLEKTMECQCRECGWDFGGFYPLEDQPDATRPTIDATCLAIMALCAFVESRERLEESLGISFLKDSNEVMRSVIDGLEFIFRMQATDGSFSIYRFENGQAGRPNENCSRVAMSTMGVCKGSGIFDRLGRSDLYSACNTRIAQVYAYICEHTAQASEGMIWAPYFGLNANDYATADVLLSSAKVCRAWIPVWWQIEQERPNLRKYCATLASYWEHHQEDGKKVGFYRFNTPTDSGFSVGDYFWPSYADMLTAFTLLQAYNMFQLALTKAQWVLIEETVQRAIDLQHAHGHLDNPLSQGTPSFAVTQAAIELFLEYQNAKGMV